MKKLLLTVLILAMAAPAMGGYVVNTFASKDAHMRGRSDLGVMNYGGSDRAAAHTDNDTIRSLVSFDLPSEIMGNPINSATLRLHLAGSYDDMQPMEVLRLTQWWNEGTGDHTPWVGVCWNAFDYATPGDSGSALPWPNGPGALGDSVSENPNFTPVPAGYGSTGTFLDVDVTASIQAAANGQPFEGFLIKFVDEVTANDDWFQYWSKDSANTPSELIIDYVPEPATVGLLALGGVFAALRRRR